MGIPRRDRKKKGSKGRAQKYHAKRRFRERLGCDWSSGRIQSLKYKIIFGKGEFIEAQSNRLSVWRVEGPGKKLIDVIYDKDRKTIVTVLPENWQTEST